MDSSTPQQMVAHRSSIASLTSKLASNGSSSSPQPFSHAALLQVDMFTACYRRHPCMPCNPLCLTCCDHRAIFSVIIYKLCDAAHCAPGLILVVVLECVLNWRFLYLPEQLEQTSKLIEAGCKKFCIDIAHGHVSDYHTTPYHTYRTSEWFGCGCHPEH